MSTGVQVQGGTRAAVGERALAPSTEVSQPTGARRSPSLPLLPTCLPCATVHARNVLGPMHDSSVLKPRTSLGIAHDCMHGLNTTCMAHR